MMLLELHFLHSFPVSCLNRDDLNSPKTAIFGGVQRARVSSQCWKRAIRLVCADIDKNKFKGQRSRQFVSEITKRLIATEANRAQALALCISHYLGRLDPTDSAKVKTIAYYSPNELDRFASVVSTLPAEEKDKLVAAFEHVDMASLSKDEEEDDTSESEGEDKPKKGVKGERKMSAKNFGKLIGRIIKPALRKEFKDTPVAKDAADIALFGRMVAADKNLNLEGAAMFSHALSTHKSDNEIDFFTAVDDLNPADDSGAGHMGTTEFNAAIYYRYVAVNLSMLADNDHLAALSADERKDVVSAFIHATLTAVPQARHNSMNAGVLPTYVLGTVKEKGQPIQLINAFESPVRPGKERSILQNSVDQLKEYHERSKGTWALSYAEEVAIPEVNVTEFVQRLTAHVL